MMSRGIRLKWFTDVSRETTVAVNALGNGRRFLLSRLLNSFFLIITLFCSWDDYSEVMPAVGLS